MTIPVCLRTEIDNLLQVFLFAWNFEIRRNFLKVFTKGFARLVIRTFEYYPEELLFSVVFPEISRSKHLGRLTHEAETLGIEDG